MTAVIFFSFFVVAVIILRLIGSKKTQGQHAELISGIKDDVKLYLSHAPSENYTNGLSNRNFLFNYCEIYITNDAFIIAGYSGIFIKSFPTPVIVTDKVDEYEKRYRFAKVVSANCVQIAKDRIRIEFGEVSLVTTFVRIQFKWLPKADFDLLVSALHNYLGL